MYPVEHIEAIAADFLRAAQEFPNIRAFIRKNGESVSYKEFHSMVIGAKNELVSRGMKLDSRVVLLVPVSVEYYAIMQAGLAMGVTITIIDPLLHNKKISEIIERAEPDLLVVGSSFSLGDMFTPSKWRVPKWKVKKLPMADGKLEITQTTDENIALLNYGYDIDVTPRGFIINYEGLTSKVALYKRMLSGFSNTGQVVFTEFPLFPLAALALGKTVVMPKQNLSKPSEINRKKMINHLIDSEVNQIVISPPLLEQVITGLDGLRSKHKLKKVITGGTQVSRKLIEEAAKLQPDVEMEILYGTSEAIPISTTNFLSLQEKMKKPLYGLSVGSVMEEVKIRIIEYVDRHVQEDEFHTLEVPSGQIGEIVCRGAHINEFYLNDDEAFRRNKITDRAGRIWHRTGDMGYFAGDELFIVGKTNRVMEKYGRMFFPYPLEFFLEVEFGLRDIAYCQTKQGKFVLFIGASPDFNEKELLESIEEAGYPIDDIETLGRPLPRDVRYKSKLSVDQLLRR